MRQATKSDLSWLIRGIACAGRPMESCGDRVVTCQCEKPHVVLLKSNSCNSFVIQISAGSCLL